VSSSNRARRSPSTASSSRAAPPSTRPCSRGRVCARRLDAIVFDKTGTLTEGRFGVSEVVALGDEGEDEILRLAASLESQSEDPIAAGIAAAAEEKGVSFPAPKGFRAIPGKGAEARVDEQPMKVVSPSYLKEKGKSVDDRRVDELAGEGHTVVFVLVDDEVRGAVALADVVRPESRGSSSSTSSSRRSCPTRKRRRSRRSNHAA
jgi:Cu2+-exporting ATPase